jgi:hypothetical protein
VLTVDTGIDGGKLSARHIHTEVGFGQAGYRTALSAAATLASVVITAAACGETEAHQCQNGPYG